jgi:hypothetical protein
MILFVVASYNLIKLTLNKFDRNHKTYIAKRFSFLLEKGYKMRYRTFNFESVSSFYKGNITFQLINEYESIDIVVRRGLKFPFEKEANIINILKGIDYEHNLNLLNPMQKIDLLAELVQENYDKIITYITK